MALKTGDKDLVFWVSVILVIVVALLIWMRRQPQPQYGQLIPGENPWQSTVPGFPDTVIGPSTYNLDFAPPNLGWISPYFPLFGFVGVDATQIYQ